MQDLQGLINVVKKLPGIGGKTAKKIAIHLAINKAKCQSLITNLESVNQNTTECKMCHNIASIANENICEICSNTKRDFAKICIVEGIEDLEIIESCGDYQGLYHILGGSISFSERILPESLNIKSLISRLSTNKIEEIIFANNATINGKITMSYVQNLIKEQKMYIQQSEISIGVPIGASVNFLDSATMSAAIKHRRQVS